MEDQSFKKMMDDREAVKERGYPSGSSHFAKMQCIGGAKPGWVGRNKDWPMPSRVPNAKENHEHMEKKSEAEEADVVGSPKTTKPMSPLEGEGNLTTMKAVLEDGTRPFKDMMIEKKAGRQSANYLPKGQSSKNPSESNAESNAKASKLAETKDAEADEKKQKEVKEGREETKSPREKQQRARAASADAKGTVRAKKKREEAEAKAEKEKGIKESTESNAKVTDRKPRYKKEAEEKEAAEKQMGKKPKYNFDQRKGLRSLELQEIQHRKDEPVRAEREMQKEIDDKDQANTDVTEEAGDYDLSQYTPDDDVTDEEEVVDTPQDGIPEAGTVFPVDADVAGTGQLFHTVGEQEANNRQMEAIDGQKRYGEDYGAVDRWKHDDEILDAIEREDMQEAQDAVRNHDYFGDRADTARAISQQTGEPVQTTLNGAIQADQSKLGTKADRAGPVAMNIVPETVQRHPFNRDVTGRPIPLGQSYGKKEVPAVESVAPTGGKKGATPRPVSLNDGTYQTTLTPKITATGSTDYSTDFRGSPVAADASATADADRLGGGPATFRELMMDKLGQKAIDYNNGKGRLPRAVRADNYRNTLEGL